MALNLDAIRKKVAQLNGERKEGPKVWKGTKTLGEHRIRILPWSDLQDGEVFKERLVYFNIGKSWITSPKSFGKHDPIDEFAKTLWQSGKEEDKALAKKLFPKLMICAAIIDRAAEDEGPQLFIMDKKQAADVLGFIIDADYGDITDVHEGFDLKIKVKETDKVYNGKKVKEAKIECSPRPSPASTDKAKLEKWLANLPNVDDYYRVKSTDEIKAQFEEWMNSGGPQAALNGGAQTEGTERGSSDAASAVDKLADELNQTKEEKKPVKEEKKTSKGKKAVDEELDDIFDSLQNSEEI